MFNMISVDSLQSLITVFFAIPILFAFVVFCLAKAVWVRVFWEHFLLLGVWRHLIFTDRYYSVSEKQIQKMRAIADKAILRKYSHFMVDLIEAKSKKYATNVANQTPKG